MDVDGITKDESVYSWNASSYGLSKTIIEAVAKTFGIVIDYDLKVEYVMETNKIKVTCVSVEEEQLIAFAYELDAELKRLGLVNQDMIILQVKKRDW